MKYILYWWWYMCPFGGGDINGVVVINDTTVSSYMYDMGYIDWNIIEKNIHVDKENKRFEHGEFILKAGNLNSVMKITHKKVYHYIQTDPSFYIVMKLKPNKKQKYVKNNEKNWYY